MLTLAQVLLDLVKTRRKVPKASLAKFQQTLNSRSIEDLLLFLNDSEMEEKDCFICLVVHNIDGPGLRDSDTQKYLALIAACSHVRVIASIDHVNSPLCKF